MKGFTVYSKLFEYDEETDEKVFIKERCMLLDIRESYWHDEDAGLAKYLESSLRKLVKSITYHCTNGADCSLVAFNVVYTNDGSDDVIVKYHGKECTLREAMCRYISGQISDGWGENGIYVVKGGWVGDAATCCNCTYELYEKDYESSDKLGKAAGLRWPRFEDFPCYKVVEFYKDGED